MKHARKFYLFFFTTLLVVGVDQVTKYLVKNAKPLLSFLFFHIQYTENTGAAFGILKSSTGLLALISLIVIGAIIYFYPKIKEEPTFVHILFGLLLGGTIGNAIDRVFRKYVIDFLGTSFWPSFNVADSAITIGVLGIIAYWILEEIKEKKKD